MRLLRLHLGLQSPCLRLLRLLCLLCLLFLLRLLRLLCLLCLLHLLHLLLPLGLLLLDPLQTPELRQLLAPPEQELEAWGRWLHRRPGTTACLPSSPPAHSSGSALWPAAAARAQAEEGAPRAAQGLL